MVYILSILTVNYLYERSLLCRKKTFKNQLQLARILLSKMCASLVLHLKNIIFSPDFINRNRNSKNSFVRQRKLPFHLLITFLINFVRGSYQDELDKFFKVLHRLGVPRRVVSKAALTKARMKLKFEAFTELDKHLVDYFENHFTPRTWLGFRLLAIDGSTTRLPIIEAISDHFGVWKVRQGAASPVARVSQLYDVLNRITIDATIYPKITGEPELAAQHLLKAMPNGLILLDRGYPIWWLFGLILPMNANFCARVPCTKWKIVRKFFHSGKAEKIIHLPIHATSVAKCREMGLDLEPLRLRLVRIENDKKVQILITSLIDTEQYPTDIFADLYHSRWPVEEDYKVIKCRMELENFSGKSPLSVYQDFHAKIFAKNLVSVMAFPLKETLDNDSAGLRYQYQINFTQAFSKSKGVIALLFNETRRMVERLIAYIQEIFQRTVEPIRPRRRYSRNHKSKPRIFFFQYKPIG